MQPTTETFGNVLVAHSPDELTGDNARQFVEAIHGHLRNGRRWVVVQMDRSDTFDGEGLELLLDLQDELRQVNGTLKISGLDEVGRQVFHITRLDRQFDIFESVIDAVSSFN